MNTLVVVSHPDPHSLTHQVAHSVVEAIRSTGTTVETADLAAENFDPRFSTADLSLYRGNGSTPPDVAEEQSRIDRAEHLVLAFPMYWWSMPALLKGWIDRVFVEGWAYEYGDRVFVKKLDRLTVHLVVVAGDDADSFERHGVYQAVRTQIERGIIEYCGATVGSTNFLYGSDTRTREELATDVSAIGSTVADRVAAQRALT
ncbi:NAD(P)H-dependent oxidoreductase [Rhodococcus sp. IEGM 1354]|uniref:NAD(P)H-dependent oxidoreductase n=1 Tax=Rhodococcus sp. IEGM 1354 TaxID=3047088 RepID=UPI0024B7C7B2|nr:NAD(P)H-dependent oxidoreductase [Rhodococcus sp. IEGM 1354]MDI9930223.1 NAD(P)H-dependent oxidoreductase [Rhodococcus sp. IEGM 1354]